MRFVIELVVSVLKWSQVYEQKNYMNLGGTALPIVMQENLFHFHMKYEPGLTLLPAMVVGRADIVVNYVSKLFEEISSSLKHRRMI